MLPNPLVVRAYLFRSARLWVGIRALTAIALGIAELPPPFPHSPKAALLFVLISTTLCFVDVWRRRERALIGNLGMSPWTLGAVSVVPPTLGELCVVIGAQLLS
jgi:hypothetical protein